MTNVTPTTDSDSKVKLGQAVTYLSSEGSEKLGFVIGTRKSIKKGTPIERPEKGNVNLMVFSPNGKRYTRNNVPPASVQDHNSFRVI